MNIFILSLIVSKCARYHCDKHVVKMILEIAQMLCTSHRVLDKITDTETILYKSTHINHPCTIWSRENSANYDWLFSLFIALCQEYTYRYDKEHLCHKKFSKILAERPKNIVISDKMTPFALAMPDYCKVPDDPVKSYRQYYINEKQALLKWTRRERPKWLPLEKET